MTARCRIIIVTLLSLILNQTAGAVLHVHSPADLIDQPQKNAVHSHDSAASTADKHCDSDDASDAFCCCNMAASDCGTSTLFAINPTLVLNYTDTWSPTDAVHRHGYYPDLEPRPPRV